jgi:hypothetical protein
VLTADSQNPPDFCSKSAGPAWYHGIYLGIYHGIYHCVNAPLAASSIFRTTQKSDLKNGPIVSGHFPDDLERFFSEYKKEHNHTSHHGFHYSYHCILHLANLVECKSKNNRGYPCI